MKNNMVKIKLGTYRHFKGNNYEVIGVATHSETLEEFVVYKALYDNKVSKLWIRPKKTFVQKVEIAGKLIPRFKFIKKS
jgi:cyclomaltodextrinase / maltogenic alpha-amylase / neopullulanase